MQLQTCFSFEMFVKHRRIYRVEVVTVLWVPPMFFPWPLKVKQLYLNLWVAFVRLSRVHRNRFTIRNVFLWNDSIQEDQDVALFCPDVCRLVRYRYCYIWHENDHRFMQHCRFWIDWTYSSVSCFRLDYYLLHTFIFSINKRGRIKIEIDKPAVL